MWGLLVWGSSLSGIQSFPQSVKSAVQAVAFAWNAASAAVHECPASTCITIRERSPRRLPPNFRLLQPLQVTPCNNGLRLAQGIAPGGPCQCWFYIAPRRRRAPAGARTG